MTPRCLVCDAPLENGDWFEGGCLPCASGAWRELLAMGDMKPGEIRIMAELLRLCGAPTCARIISRVPFGPPYSELGQ